MSKFNLTCNNCEDRDICTVFGGLCWRWGVRAVWRSLLGRRLFK